MASLKHRSERRAGETVLVFEGEIDLATSKTVRGILLQALDATPKLSVDLSRVGYIDSSGVANLIEALQRARSAGKTFRVAAASEPVLLVLRMARLEGILLG